MATKKHYKKSKRSKTMKRYKKGGQEKPKGRSWTTSIGVGLLNSGVRTASMGARMVFRTAVSQAVKAKVITQEVGDKLNAIFDQGTRGATKAVNYATSIKAQQDLNSARENPTEFLQKGLQKGKEQLSSALNSEQVQNARERVSSAVSSALNSEPIQKARSFVGNQVNRFKEESNQNQNQNQGINRIASQTIPKTQTM
jgi:hypothetical protein